MFSLALVAVKAMPALIGAIWLWFEGVALSVGAPLNFLVNIAGAVAVVYAIVKVGKSKVKDDTINDLQNSIEAKDGRLRDLSEQLADAKQQARQIEQAANHCRDEATAWRSKYEEQSNYTAENALETVVKVLEQNDKAHERRHTEIMRAFETLNSAVRNDK